MLVPTQEFEPIPECMGPAPAWWKPKPRERVDNHDGSIYTTIKVWSVAIDRNDRSKGMRLEMGPWPFPEDPGCNDLVSKMWVNAQAKITELSDEGFIISEVVLIDRTVVGDPSHGYFYKFKMHKEYVGGTHLEKYE